MADGSIIAVRANSPTCNAAFGSGNYANICAHYCVDLNGKKNPNKFGADIFLFFITKNGIMPAGADDNSEAKSPNGYAYGSFGRFCKYNSPYVTGNGPSGIGCTAWVLYNENMDYLHCDGLSWAGKKKCD